MVHPSPSFEESFFASIFKISQHRSYKGSTLARHGQRLSKHPSQILPNSYLKNQF